MPRAHNTSPETLRLLEAFLAHVDAWRYGYDLSKETQLKSGTLYPILMRLELQGWLETQWEDELTPGRPPRHHYRLTATGVRDGRTLMAAMRRRQAWVPGTSGEALA